jgi:AcrR family transcriptional regulator
MSQLNNILSLGEDKFFKEGFSRVKMSDIASELRMSKKTLYRFFPSKEKLAQAIAKHFMENAKSKIIPALESKKNAVEKLNDLITLLAEISGKISTKKLEEMKNHFPSIWNEVDKFRTQMMFGNITKVIDQGKKEGLFKDYPTPIIMNILVASVRTVVNPEFVLNNNFSLIEAARTAFKIVIGGIITEKGEKFLAINKRMKNENN